MIMQSAPIIEVKNVSKKYNITHERGRYISIRDVITNIIKSPFAFLKTRIKRVTGIEKKEEFWALKDINFNVMRGEVVGIIGRNGAGKSTLLKILSQITPPSTGEIRLNGRVGSLLEVGTGFHPELTGRENIFLNGAILGMKRAEIVKKFDEIVAFAGIEKFLDTPVKHYSSGMYVRLAFSVAAHMEPDILIIDEVLAVGDAEFQKKCLGKMDEITKEGGRTILFVSHNMTAISSLCTRVILIDKGQVLAIGSTEEIIRKYSNEQRNHIQKDWKGDAGDEDVRLHRASVRSLDPHEQFRTDAAIEISIECEILRPVSDLILGICLFSEFGYQIAYSLYDDREKGLAPTIPKGSFVKRFVIPANTLAQGSYRIELDIGINNIKRIIGGEKGQLTISLENVSGLGQRYPQPPGPGRSSFLRPDWAVK